MAADEPPGNIQAAEWQVLSYVNQFRANHGVGPLRMATRVRHCARDRSRSMKNQGYFAHVSPAGVDAADLLDQRSVRYRSWAENIGWTRYFDLDAGSRWMVDWWKNSPPHRRNLLDRSLNYVGVGIAKQGPYILYTLVLVNQADHTPPKAGIARANARVSTASLRSSSSNVTVRWWGKDRRLSSRTAGLRGFTVHHRRADGTWRRLLKDTTSRQITLELPRGTHQFRVRATDKRGNKGAWQRPLTVVVD